jgi:hypothetical protein
MRPASHRGSVTFSEQDRVSYLSFAGGEPLSNHSACVFVPSISSKPIISRFFRRDRFGCTHFATVRTTTYSRTLVCGVCGSRYLPVFPPAGDGAPRRHSVRGFTFFGCRDCRVYVGWSDFGSIPISQLRPSSSSWLFNRRTNVRDICRALRLCASHVGRAMVVRRRGKPLPLYSHARNFYGRPAGCYKRYDRRGHSFQIRPPLLCRKWRPSF